MPIRISSLTKRISRNGQALHRAMASRLGAGSGEGAPSADEAALLQERAELKQERARREARAAEPKATAVERLVRTHHPEPKDRAKATKEGKGSKEAKAGKPHRTRAEKHAAKAAAIDAARRAPKKPAKA